MPPGALGSPGGPCGGPPGANFFVPPSPLSPLLALSWAAALWGAPPVQFTLVRMPTRANNLVPLQRGVAILGVGNMERMWGKQQAQTCARMRASRPPPAATP